jgi:hypothetical protein
MNQALYAEKRRIQRAIGDPLLVAIAPASCVVYRRRRDELIIMDCLDNRYASTRSDDDRRNRELWVELMHMHNIWPKRAQQPLRRLSYATIPNRAASDLGRPDACRLCTRLSGDNCRNKYSMPVKVTLIGGRNKRHLVTAFPQTLCQL